MPPSTLYAGDCLQVLPTLPADSIDAIVTDPPYGLAFMGKDWDHGVPGVEFWRQALRVSKPGAHLVAFGGTRTHHRLMVAIEDAGWEIRDCLMWLYGSGFPKSLDVSKAIDKARKDDIEHVRACLRTARDAKGLTNTAIAKWFGFTPTMAAHWIDHPSQPTLPTMDQWAILKARLEIDVPEIDAEVVRLNARKGNPGDAWQRAEIVGEHEGSTPGLGGDRFSVRDSLKRAPASDAAQQWQGWGTALKPAWEPIVFARKPLRGTVAANVQTHGTGAINVDGCRIGTSKRVPGAPRGPQDRIYGAYGAQTGDESGHDPNIGRWPANLLLDEDSASALDAQTGVRRSAGDYPSDAQSSGIFGDRSQGPLYSDSGGPSRFFYCAKASCKDRGEGNTHPTVKPTDLMRWLVRLVTPAAGVVLDPFMGSGSTGKAATLEGRAFMGIDQDPAYVAIARARIDLA